MSININGYSLSNSSGLTLGTAGTIINSSGLLTVPNLPAMFGAQTNYGGIHNQYPWQVNSTSVNVNSNWNGTVFTCPVAGLYCMSLQFLFSGGYEGGGSGYFGPVKNGTLQYFTYSNCSVDYWDGTNFTTLIPCSAGDTLSWAVNVAPAPVGGAAGAYGSNHNGATIWLIG